MLCVLSLESYQGLATTPLRPLSPPASLPLRVAPSAGYGIDLPSLRPAASVLAPCTCYASWCMEMLANRAAVGEVRPECHRRVSFTLPALYCSSPLVVSRRRTCRTELQYWTFTTAWCLGTTIVSTEENHPDVQVPPQVFGNAGLEFVDTALREIDATRCPAEPMRNSIAMDVHRKDGPVERIHQHTSRGLDTDTWQGS